MAAKPVKIEYVPAIDGTPVLPFVLDSYMRLRTAGNIEANSVPACGSEEAFYIKNRAGKIVAVLSFFKNDDTDLVINMGFVLKAYRKRGYYRALWNRLVEEGRARGMKTITGYHKPGNDDILKFNESVGRRLKCVCSEFVL